jgi:serine/threonine protein kinase/Tfp pilus assembly protein PilF
VASLIGQTVSHYKILEKLGGGGMGVVYKAEDTKLKRTVALKFLPPDLARDPEAKERFIHEAQATSALQDYNICVVYDIDETPDGQMFISMEYLEGETLKKKIERGPLKIEEAVSIALQIAQGLAKAHEHEIVHRDIKPANVMVTSEGVVKIVDFGLAKLSSRTMLTKTGSTLGTAAYMSPEQARGEPADHRTDIWSLGIVLYEMLTGKRPFEAEYENALLYSILNSEPEPITALRTGVPMELDRVVQKCLSKNPLDRYQHIDEVLVDLRSCSRFTSQIGALTQRSTLAHRRNRRLFWYGTVAGLVALALVAYVLLSRQEASPSRLKMIAVLPFENLGPAEDEYFADGLTDEITSRLSSISTLGVISRQSARQYKKSSKTLPLVAQELGVDYILEGTIRWVKTGSSQRIRITPQLIQVKGDTHLWADNIDRTLDDIFSVQTDIAMRVVTSLNIVLGEAEKRTIETIPTKNLDAYQAYLRGRSFGGTEGPKIKMAIEMFQRAVELDTTFGLAYAALSFAHLNYYWQGQDRTKERLSIAKQCLDRAFALEADLPQAYYALGYYFLWGYRDYERALDAFAIAAKRLPNDSDILAAIAFICRRQGKFEEALERLKKAFALKPQGEVLASQIGATLKLLGKYPEAETYYDRSISLLPDQGHAYVGKADTYLLWHGDTEKSRNTLEQVPTQYQAWQMLTWVDIYERRYQSALDRLDHSPVNTSADMTPVKGLIYRFMNDSVRSFASFESARVFLVAEIAKRPDDWILHRALAIVNAGLGRREAALREAQLTVDLLPLSTDALDGVWPVIALAEVYVMIGDYDAATDKLEFLLALRAPKYLTVPILRLDPTYDPLRSNPRFQALLAKYG